MENCIFCKIIAGDIPSPRMYEDEDMIVIKDIEPKAPFHAVIIPKEHILERATDVTPENSAIIGKIFEAAAKIAKENSLDGGFRLINNCGADAGQTVFHLHVHMLAGKNLGDII